MGGFLRLTNSDYNFGFALITQLVEDIGELGYRGLRIKYEVEDNRSNRFGAVKVYRPPCTVEVELLTQVVRITTVVRDLAGRHVASESYDLADPQSLDRFYEILKEKFG